MAAVTIFDKESLWLHSLQVQWEVEAILYTVSLQNYFFTLAGKDACTPEEYSLVSFSSLKFLQSSLPIR